MQKIDSLFGFKVKKDGTIAKSNFQIVGNPETLFTPDFSLLKDKRCPKCTLKLYQTYNKKLWVCKGKKHKQQFVVTDKKLKSYPQVT